MCGTVSCLGAESTHQSLDVQLVLELPVGQGVSGHRLFPLDQTVRHVAVHADVVGRAVYFCNENPGRSLSHQAATGPQRPDPVLWAAHRWSAPGVTWRHMPWIGVLRLEEGEDRWLVCRFSGVHTGPSSRLQGGVGEPNVWEGWKYGDWPGTGPPWGQPRLVSNGDRACMSEKTGGAPGSFNNERYPM